MNFCLKKEDVRRAVYKFKTMLADNYSEKAITQTLSKEQLLVVALYGFQKFREMGFDFESEEAVTTVVYISVKACWLIKNGDKQNQLEQTSTPLDTKLPLTYRLMDKNC